MPDDFDPYRKWLAIPPEEQPPNHYRLLGIPLLEEDPDVIENAANRQMAHVRTFQSGRHAALSQKILNELSVAKLCLLNPEKKAAYDETIQAELAAAAPVPSHASPPPPRQSSMPNVTTAETAPALSNPSPFPNPGPSASAGVSVRGSRSVRPGSAARRVRRRGVPWGMMLMGALAVISLAIVLAVVVNLAQPTPPRPPRAERPEPSPPPIGSYPAAPDRLERPETPRPEPTSPFTPPVLEPDPGTPDPSPPSVAEADDPNPANAARFEQKIQETRDHLGNRDLGKALDSLREARRFGTTESQKDRIEQVRTLLDYLNQFQTYVHQGIHKDLEDGDTFEFEGKSFQIESREGMNVTYSVDGQTYTSTEKEMPALHALAFASRQIGDEDVFDMIYAATFLALDRRDNDPQQLDAFRDRAKQLWQAAAELGHRNEWVAQELGIEI